MGKQEFDETVMRSFWDWFERNTVSNALQLVRDIGLRLQQLSGKNEDRGWFDLGFDSRQNKGTLMFWCEDKHCQNCWRQLVKLAPESVKANWVLSVN